MGSSSNGTYQDPGGPPAPPNVTPYGQSAPYAPRFVNFLPSDNSMATGLTPDMSAGISANSGPPPAAPMAAAASPAAAQTTSSDVANMRKQIAQLMMAQNYAGYQGRLSGPNAMYQGGSWSGGRAGGGGVGGYGPGHS